MPTFNHTPLLASSLLLCATLLISGCQSKLTGGVRDKGSVAHAATTPLRDVGLMRPQIPEALQHMHYPYTMPPADCGVIAAEIKMLDGLLGEESYQPSDAKSLTTRAGDEAEGYAISSIANAAADALPYRAWVRRLSGANSADRKAATAYLFGEQRRTFLRGYSTGLACQMPLPAAPVSNKVRNDSAANEPSATLEPTQADNSSRP